MPRTQDGVVGTPYCVQAEAQFTDAGFTGPQPAEQRRIGMSVMKLVGGETKTHGVSFR
jgi:hypothetical protein